MAKKDFQKHGSHWTDDLNYTASEFVYDKLVQYDYFSSTETESISNKMDGVMKMLPGLVEKLYEKGLLTKEEVEGLF